MASCVFMALHPQQVDRELAEKLWFSCGYQVCRVVLPNGLCVVKLTCSAAPQSGPYCPAPLPGRRFGGGRLGAGGAVGRAEACHCPLLITLGLIFRSWPWSMVAGRNWRKWWGWRT